MQLAGAVTARVGVINGVNVASGVRVDETAAPVTASVDVTKACGAGVSVSTEMEIHEASRRGINKNNFLNI